MDRTSSLMFRSNSDPIAVISSFNALIRTRVGSSLSTPARLKSRRILNRANRVSALWDRASRVSNASYKARFRLRSVRKLIPAWYARFPASRTPASAWTLKRSSPCCTTSDADRRISLYGTRVLPTDRRPFTRRTPARRVFPREIPAFASRSTAAGEFARASFGVVIRAPLAPRVRRTVFDLVMANLGARSGGGISAFPRRAVDPSGSDLCPEAGAAVHAEHRLGRDRLAALRTRSRRGCAAGSRGRTP